MSEVTEVRWRNDTWTARWFGANSHQANPPSTTHCACYYVEGTGAVDAPFMLHNYRVKEVPGTSDHPVDKVCQPYYVECPKDMKGTQEKYGDPWLEHYEGC